MRPSNGFETHTAYCTCTHIRCTVASQTIQSGSYRGVPLQPPGQNQTNFLVPYMTLKDIHYVPKNQR